MEISTKHLRESYQGFALMSQTVMPTKVGMKVAAVRIKLLPFWEAAEEDRIKLCKRFAEKDDKGNMKTKDDGKAFDFGDRQAEFDDEFQVWNDVAVDVGEIKPIKRHEFGEKFNLEPEIWFAVRHFVDFGE